MSDFPYLDALERELVAAARASAARTEGLPSDGSATPAPASMPGLRGSERPPGARDATQARSPRARRPAWADRRGVVLLGASAGALAATGVLSGSPLQVSSASCEISGGGFVSGPMRATEESCMYVLSDGQRFRCPGPIGHMTRSVTNLEHSKTCVQLSKLPVPPGKQRVFAAIADSPELSDRPASVRERRSCVPRTYSGRKGRRNAASGSATTGRRAGRHERPRWGLNRLLRRSRCSQEPRGDGRSKGDTLRVARSNAKAP